MSGRLAYAALPASLVLLMVVAGCLSSSKPKTHASIPSTPARLVALTPSPGVVETPAPASSHQYVGDHPCAACHPDISDLYSHSAHATTVRAVTLQADGALFRSLQAVRDSSAGAAYHLEVRGGACLMVAQKGGDQETVRARYAFGGDRYGLSYLGQDKRGQWLEIRLSYYTRLHRWYYTPFLQPDKEYRQYLLGLPLDDKQFALCFSCHVTTLQMAPNGPRVPESHFQVGCERCHGPGRAHLDALRVVAAGKQVTSSGMEHLRTAPRARIMRLCADCHSSPADMPPSIMATAVMARFAANALQQSQCYLRSKTLSCISCHDPHTLGPTRSGSYEAVCLGCHGGSSAQAQGHSSEFAEPNSAQRAAVCKVSPKSGCIRCHMPVQTTRSFSLIGFHNHWIRIYTGLDLKR